MLGLLGVLVVLGVLHPVESPGSPAVQQSSGSAIKKVRDNMTIFESRSKSYPHSVIDADVDFDALP